MMHGAGFCLAADEVLLPLSRQIKMRSELRSRNWHSAQGQNYKSATTWSQD